MPTDCCNTINNIRPNDPRTYRRPSLYASMRLACLVYRVKERLRCRAQQRTQPKQNFDSFQESLQTQAQRDRYRCHGFVDRGQVEQKTVKGNHSQHEVPRLLTELDQHVSDDEFKTRTVAEHDELFLTYNVKGVTRSKGIDELRHIYDLTSILLAKLPSFLLCIVKGSRPLKSPTSASGDQDREKAIANLAHILRCLQQAALGALIFHGLRSLEEDLQQWHQHWLWERQLDLGWFFEWPNGRRPLSTTWPWNIKPSLVVLWGVCWMFYDNSTRSAEELRQQLEKEGVASSVWTRPTPQSATSSQPNITSWISADTDLPFQHPASLQTEGNSEGARVRRAKRTPEYNTTLPGYKSHHPAFLSPYISSYPVVAQNHFSDPSLTWPQSQGSYSLPVLPRNTGNSSLPTSPLAHRHSAPSSAATFSPGYNSWQDPLPYQPQHSQQQSQTSIPDYPSIVPSHTNQPHALFSLRPTSQGSSRAVAAFSPSLQLPMGHMQNYPSPHSDVSKDERRSSTFSYLPSNDLSPNMMLVASPSVQSHHSPSSAGKRGEEPPRNASGQITCNHPKCASDQPVFSRRCEWTKHMDKHTRPYVCNLPGCEKIRGFTYSGGLSRHQREVHRSNGGPKASYMCPHKDCKRSTGSGFSRKENLQEHLRRVHRQVGEAEVEKHEPAEAASPATAEPRRRRRRYNDDDDENDEAPAQVLRGPRKRRRSDDDESKEHISESQSSGEDLSVQVKRLRKELRDTDERLRKLERTVELLTQKLA